MPIQLSVKPDWSSMGDTQYFAKNATVGGNIPAIRVDPPKLNEQQLERYQTNVYFEKSGKVYVFDCVHNWKEDYLETCNTMFDTIKFE